MYDTSVLEIPTVAALPRNDSFYRGDVGKAVIYRTFKTSR